MLTKPHYDLAFVNGDPCFLFSRTGAAGQTKDLRRRPDFQAKLVTPDPMAIEFLKCFINYAT